MWRFGGILLPHHTDWLTFSTSANVSVKLAVDSHIRRLRPLDLPIQREQSLVLNMSQRIMPAHLYEGQVSVREYEEDRAHEGRMQLSEVTVTGH